MKLLCVMMAVCMAPAVTSASIFVPTGLLPGEMYHLAFVTQSTRDATSSSIADYNAFVQDQAALNPSLTGTDIGVMYNAIASTSSVHARDNALVEASVYLFDSTKIADGFDDMWDGDLDALLNVNQHAGMSTDIVWTGSSSSGYGWIGGPLGNNSVVAGATDELGYKWIAGISWHSDSTSPFYGLSQKLTVPAVPGTVTTTGDVDPGPAGTQEDPWKVGTTLTVGKIGVGTLSIFDGGAVDSGSYYGRIGEGVDSTGEATISGPGSHWTNLGHITVGQQGHGTLKIEAGGMVSNTYGYIGAYSTGEESRPEDCYEYMGDDGAECGYGYEYEGEYPNGNKGEQEPPKLSTGIAIVTGASSRWNNSQDLAVGIYGNGTLNINNGGVVSNVVGTVGQGSGSTGVATIRGTGSHWNNSKSLTVGGIEGSTSHGSGGHGTLKVEAGGMVSNTTGYIGGTHGSTGVATVTGSDSRWINSDSLTVGNASNGTLNITDGGVVSSASGVIARHSNNSTVTVSGANSRWNNSGSLTVGWEGEGVLTIDAGGTVSNTDGYMGWTQSSKGEVIVNGAGSTWLNSGDLHVGIEENAYNTTNGSLSITDGGFVNVSGTVHLYSNNTMNINGGSLVTPTLDLKANSSATLNSGVLWVNHFTGEGRLTWNGGTLQISNPNGLAVGRDDPFGGLMNIGINQKLLVTGTTTIERDASITTQTQEFTSNRLKIDSGATLNASGQVAAKVIGLPDSSIVVTGPLTVGNAADYGGFDHQGSLSVGSHNVTLNTKGFATLGSLTTIDNGTLQADNGISLGTGRVLTGSGTVEAKLAAGFGSTIEAIGDLDLGSASSVSGFFSDGELIVGSHTVTIHDQNIAVLGSVTNLGSETDEGTLVAANGLLIEQGKSLTGYGLVTGDLVNQGNVYGDSTDVDERLVFDTDHTVSGIGSFMNVQFNGTYSPGQSPGITHLTDTTFGSSATVEIELGGINAGSEYDRIVAEGSLLSLDGRLLVDLIDGFTPSEGDAFQIFDFSGLTSNQIGEFDLLTLPPLSDALGWDSSDLYNRGTLSVIPELAVLKGDVDDDGNVNNLDITPFIAALAAADEAAFLTQFPNGNYAAADIDMSGNPNNLDITPFIGLLTAAGSNATAVPEPSSLACVALVLMMGRRRHSNR